MIGLFSPMLQGEIAWAMHSKWLESLDAFQRCSTDFIAELAISLEQSMFPQGEFFARTLALYILHRGLASRKGRVRRAGDAWGDDCILADWSLCEAPESLALTFVEVLSINPTRLLQMRGNFPVDDAKLRKAAVRLALRRSTMLGRAQVILEDYLANGSVSDEHKPISSRSSKQLTIRDDEPSESKAVARETRDAPSGLNVAWETRALLDWHHRFAQAHEDEDTAILDVQRALLEASYHTLQRMTKHSKVAIPAPCDPADEKSFLRM